MKLSELIRQLDDIVEADGRPYGADYSCVLLGLPGEIDGLHAIELSAQELRLVIDGLCLVEIDRGMEREGWDLESDRDATRGLAKRLRDRRDGTARYRYRS